MPWQEPFRIVPFKATALDYAVPGTVRIVPKEETGRIVPCQETVRIVP